MDCAQVCGAAAEPGTAQLIVTSVLSFFVVAVTCDMCVLCCSSGVFVVLDGVML